MGAGAGCGVDVTVSVLGGLAAAAIAAAAAAADPLGPGIVYGEYRYVFSPGMVPVCVLSMVSNSP